MIPMSGLKQRVAVEDGAAGVPSISFSADSNTGLYRPGGDSLGVVTGGVDRMRMDASGNVGIGTTNPQVPLHVLGQLTCANPGWLLYNAAGGNAVYDTIGKYWGSSIGGNTVVFNTVDTFNGANANAWNSTTGLFTFPSTGVYMIVIHMFINGSTSGRNAMINFTNSVFTQYMPFDPANYPINTQRSFTTLYFATAGDTFFANVESGSMTLFLGKKHTNFIIYRIG